MESVDLAANVANGKRWIYQMVQESYFQKCLVSNACNAGRRETHSKHTTRCEASGEAVLST